MIAAIAAARLSPEAIAKNFADLHPPLHPNEARVASERCLFCFDAPCVAACPTGIDIPLFIRQISTGMPLNAATTILQSNIMGGMCARVCPTETLCEEACVRMESEGKPVEIGQLQRFATDTLMADGRQIFSRAAPTGRRIAVVGAGPAGLACAHGLARLGHDVTVFEAREKSGGLNEFGIAAYKTVNDFAAREAEWILGIGGIQVKHGQRLGHEVHLADLRRAYDAVFLGMGLGGNNVLGIDHSGITGVEEAVQFIAALRQAKDKAALPIGRRILVIGGGMTAIDMATQARRLGAEEVTIAYRRGQAEMKASRFEQELAQKDGVLIRHWLRPRAFHAGPGGALQGVEFETAGSGTIVLPCDQLFLAVGQTLLPGEIGEGSIVLEQGRIKVDFAGKTSLEKVWAGGDCIVGGKDLTVSAVEDGKQAAKAIDAALRNAGVPPARAAAR